MFFLLRSTRFWLELRFEVSVGGRDRKVRSNQRPSKECHTPMAKKAAGKAPGSSAGRPKSATKGEVFGAIAEHTSLSKKDVSKVFEGLVEVIGKELGKKGPGLFQIPGLLKIKVVNKPATKAKQGINPFTKEPMMIKAKPARRVIKAVPLKQLKEMV
jgi:nucleoid DNA-binding protein